MNGIYLHLLLKEIRDRVVNARVEEALIHERILQVVLDNASLYISLYPAGLGMFLSETEGRYYEPLRKISDAIKSWKVMEVLQEDLMPVCNITLEKSFPKQQRIRMAVSFYPQAPNVSVIAGARRSSVFPRYVEKKAKASILDIDEAQLIGDRTEYLVKNYEGIDKKMARELDKRNFRLLKGMLEGEPVRPRLVSARPLHVSLFAPEYEEEYSSFNDLYKTAINCFMRVREEEVAGQQKQLIMRNMRRRMARLNKKLLAPTEIENLRIMGELILANMTRMRRGSASVTVLNTYTQMQMKIELDPQLSPQENAHRYFARYKKEKRGQPKIHEQINRLAKELNKFEAKPYTEFKVHKEKREEKQPVEPFHRFVLTGGSVILAGKNARSNDELTFKYARASDYFFHTRGYEGAHVILRPNVPKGQHPSREEVRVAASIAAYFSKAKKQNNVPVSYTQRKYLKKSKKGKIGSVILMREEVVFVEPGLPDREITK